MIRGFWVCFCFFFFKQGFFRTDQAEVVTLWILSFFALVLSLACPSPCPPPESSESRTESFLHSIAHHWAWRQQWKESSAGFYSIFLHYGTVAGVWNLMVPDVLFKKLHFSVYVAPIYYIPECFLVDFSVSIISGAQPLQFCDDFLFMSLKSSELFCHSHSGALISP